MPSLIQMYLFALLTLNAGVFYLKILVSFGSSTPILNFFFSEARDAVIISLVLISPFHVCMCAYLSQLFSSSEDVPVGL